MTLSFISTYWTSNNRVLDFGQIGYETDTGLAKIGDGVAAWNSLAYGDPITEYSTVTGTTTCIIDQSMPLVKDYFRGMRLRLRFTSANTGAVTINLNGLGAKSVRKNVSTALVAGDIVAGQIVEVVYDAVNGWFQLVSTLATTAGITGTLTANVATMGASSSSVTDSTWEYNGNTYRPRTNGSDIGDATHRVQNLYMGTTSAYDYVTSLQWNQSAVKKLSMVDAGGGATRIQLFNSSYFAADATLGWKINDSTDAINIITFNNDGTLTQATNNLKIASRINLSNASNSYFLANATLGFLVNNDADSLNLFKVFNAGDVQVYQGNLNVGTVAALLTSKVNITGTVNGFFGSTVTNTSAGASAQAGAIFGESLTNFAAFARLNSTATGNMTGTSVANANTTYLQNTTGGTNFNGNVALRGNPLYFMAGSTTTNKAARLDADGLLVTTLASVHTAVSSLTSASFINVLGSNGYNVVNSTTTSYTAMFLTQNSTNYGGLQRLNSAFVGNYTGTSLPMATHVNFFTVNNTQPFTVSGSATYSLTGTTNTNAGWVNTTTGFKVCELLDIHNAPTEWFSVRKDQTGAATIASLINAGNGTAARAYWAISNSSSLATALFLQSLSAAFTTSGIRVADSAVISTNKAAGMKVGTTTATTYTVYTNDTPWIQTTSTGLTFFGGTTTATAWAHYAAGTTTVAPNRFTSGTLTTGANILAGNFEFLTDDYWVTISTGPSRKGIVLNDGTNLTSGRVPITTTNGRLTDDAAVTYSGSTLGVPHLKGTSSTPTVAIGAAGAGANATTSVSGTDMSGTISVTTSALDTPLGNSVIVTLTFNVAYGVAPRVVFIPSNSTAWNLASGVARLIQANVTTTTFAIESGATPLTALTAATYTWNYVVIQ